MCNQSQGYYGSNNTLSPAAQAILTAVTQSQYCLDPSDIPNEAARMASIAAAALEALADQVVPEQVEPPCGETEPWPQGYQLMRDAQWEKCQQLRSKILAIAAELKSHD